MSASLRVLAAAIALVLVAGVLTVVVRGIDPGAGHPDEWDPRVRQLAAYVETARGLSFEHPVEVQFLSADEYREVTGGELPTPESAAEVAEELEGQVARLRALGVVSGDLDLGEVLDQTVDASTLAFYRPEDETIRVRGTQMTVGLEVTLVHELTHALQDQHFDLDGLLYGDDVEPGAANAALGLVEGDATRIEELYVAEALSDAEQDTYFEEYDAEIERSEQGNAGVPAFIQATFGVPYALGPTFVSMLANAGGNRDVDHAFREPPTTEEHLFDPASYLADESEAAVDTGIDADDAEETGPFGITRWFLVLAERIDPFDALQAAIGWDGDEYAIVEEDGRVCVRAVFRGDSEAEEAQMGEAIDAWVAALPGGEARRLDVEGHPAIDACDPGPEVDLELRDRSDEALVVPYLWGTYIAAHAHEGPERARCIAQAALLGGSPALPYERVVDPSPEVREAVADDLRRLDVLATSTCGVGER